LYSKREVESKIFIRFIRCFADAYTQDASVKIAEYLVALSKVKGAKLMAKFLVKREKTELREFAEKLEKNSDCWELIKQFKPVLLP